MENVLKQNCSTLRRLAKWNRAINEWNRDLQEIQHQGSLSSLLTLPTINNGDSHDAVTSNQVQNSSHRNTLPASLLPVRSVGSNNNNDIIGGTSFGIQGEQCSTSLREWLPTTSNI